MKTDFSDAVITEEHWVKSTDNEEDDFEKNDYLLCEIKILDYLMEMGH